jgi:signal transduction histidine kinase
VAVEADLGRVEGDVLGSHSQTMQVLMNLIANAMEALPDGGKIRITTSTRHLDAPWFGYEDVPQGSYATLEVSDGGVGIEPEDIKKIFEPFYTSKKMGMSGTGLGMALVYTIVKDHQGYIDVTSNQGAGTTFTIFLPLDEVPADSEETAPDDEESELDSTHTSRSSV